MIRTHAFHKQMRVFFYYLPAGSSGIISHYEKFFAKCIFYITPYLHPRRLQFEI